MKQRPINPQRITQPVQVISKAQQMFNDFFSGESFWHLPQDNLPKINHILQTGSGIIKSQDINRETAACFGMRRRRLQQ